jgi:hypothetical protein
MMSLFALHSANSVIVIIFLQCTINEATITANIVAAINAIRKSRSRVIFIDGQPSKTIE